MKTWITSTVIALAASLSTAASAQMGGATAPSQTSPAASPANRVAPARVIVVDTPPPPPPAGVPLRLGMKRSDIRQLLGKPAAVRPIEVDQAKAEVWVYARPAVQQVRPVTTSMREVPYVDPITNEMRMLKEPIVDYLTETHQVELRLLMFRGQLINWAEIPTGVQRNYN